jgi:hypothetical protein
LPEILELHDLSRDSGAGSADNFRKRSLANAQNRCLHHHVFNVQTAREMLVFLGVQVPAVEELSAIDILAVGIKASSPVAA